MGARFTYNYKDIVAFKALWGLPRFGMGVFTPNIEYTKTPVNTETQVRGADLSFVKPFYYQDDIDIGVSLTDLLCNCIETQPCNYEIQQPRMNREQRRKAEREKRKKYKIQNGKKVDLDMNLKGVWGNKE